MKLEILTIYIWSVFSRKLRTKSFFQLINWSILIAIPTALGLLLACFFFSECWLQSHQCLALKKGPWVLLFGFGRQQKHTFRLIWRRYFRGLGTRPWNYWECFYTGDSAETWNINSFLDNQLNRRDASHFSSFQDSMPFATTNRIYRVLMHISAVRPCPIMLV